MKRTAFFIKFGTFMDIVKFYAGKAHFIGNIYEFDFGNLSGWIYSVNGARMSVGVDQYVLKDGDRVELHYTLELGKDLE